jgi:hypothetical protein
MAPVTRVAGQVSKLFGCGLPHVKNGVRDAGTMT